MTAWDELGVAAELLWTGVKMAVVGAALEIKEACEVAGAAREKVEAWETTGAGKFTTSWEKVGSGFSTIGWATEVGADGACLADCLAASACFIASRAEAKESPNDSSLS
jgi:hypothetical protein